MSKVCVDCHKKDSTIKSLRERVDNLEWVIEQLLGSAKERGYEIALHDDIKRLLSESKQEEQ